MPGSAVQHRLAPGEGFDLADLIPPEATSLQPGSRPANDSDA